VLLVHPNSIEQPQQLARYATLAKKKAKSAGGNAFVVVETHTISIA
jgi:hypothetical protein